MSDLQSLLARVEALESTRCTCLKCVDASRERIRAARHERNARIMRLSRDERNAALIALGDGHELSELLKALGQDAVRVVIEAPDEKTRERWYELIGSAYRDLVDIESVEVPRLVRITARPHVRIERGRLIVDPATQRKDSAIAARLEAAGIVVSNSNGNLTINPLNFLADGVSHVLTAAGFAAMCSVDERFDEWISNGQLIATPLTDAENRAILLEEWSTHPKQGANARKQLPPRNPLSATEGSL